MTEHEQDGTVGDEALLAEQPPPQRRGISRRDLAIAALAAGGGFAAAKVGDVWNYFFGSRDVPFEVEANWQQPFADGEVTPELITLVARTLPTERAMRAGWRVSHTNFTTPDLDWPVEVGDPEQGTWRFLRVTPNDQGISSVTAEGTLAGATPGQQLTFGFDVYGSNVRNGLTGKVLSPHGERRVFFKQKSQG